MIVRQPPRKKMRWTALLPLFIFPCIYFLIQNPSSLTERITQVHKPNALSPSREETAKKPPLEAPTIVEQTSTVMLPQMPATEPTVPLFEDRRTNSSSERKLPCAPYLLYDKPPKTGSSAIFQALRIVYERIGQTYAVCGNLTSCGILAGEICEGTAPPQNLIMHISITPAVRSCLREKYNYYMLTSVREPGPRWDSAFLYNQWKESCHFSICHNETYLHFMNNIPVCNHFEYRDRIGDKTCAKGNVDGRIATILQDYEEVIDLYGPPLSEQGPIARVVSKHMQARNKSPRPKQEFQKPYDTTRLAYETKLYDALQQHGKELLARTTYRTYCTFDDPALLRPAA